MCIYFRMSVHVCPCCMFCVCMCLQVCLYVCVYRCVCVISVQVCVCMCASVQGSGHVHPGWEVAWKVVSDRGGKQTAIEHLLRKLIPIVVTVTETARSFQLL